MSARTPGVALLLVLACAGLRADAPAWILRSLPADSDGATALLLQADGDAAPEWGLLIGNELTIAEIAPEPPARTLALPAGTSLFDLRDSDRDGQAELAAVRAGRLEFWRDAAAAATADPDFSIEDPRIAAISIGAPQPYPLFLEDKGEDFLSLPLEGAAALWSLDGAPVSQRQPAPPRWLKLTQFHAWSEATLAKQVPAGEIRIFQHYERKTSQADAEPAAIPAPRSGGTRRARDAGAAPAEEWPWFTLKGQSRVLYALAPPDFRDTLVRVDRREAGGPALNPRRFPGILIPPGETGSDFNADGFNDLLLWRAPRPGASLDALIRAAQDGEWDVTLTVHLFDSASGRFEARPINWIHTKAPLEGVLAGGVRGPFDYLSVEDLDGNGRADLLCSGAGRELAAWTFSGRREPQAWARVSLGEAIEEVVLTERIPGYRWLGVARGAQAFHLLALPKR